MSKNWQIQSSARGVLFAISFIIAAVTPELAAPYYTFRRINASRYTFAEAAKINSVGRLSVSTLTVLVRMVWILAFGWELYSAIDFPASKSIDAFKISDQRLLLETS